MPFGHACLSEWPLDPAVIYLNHGTVGVTPLRVLEAQRRIRDEVERAPAQFLFRRQSSMAGARHGEPSLVRQAAAAVAAFVGARARDIAFVDNATSGVNAVLRSIRLEPGDEVLVTDQTYGAIVKAAQLVTRQQGATVRVVSVPYPRFSPAVFVEAIAAGITPRTRLAILDHLAAESALIMPLAETARVCRAHGVRVVADGAHVPGMLPLDVPSLGVDWYVANLHKWACAPRSCAFIWANEAAQVGLHPAVISWGLDQGFEAEFDWVGTRDVSSWLAVPEALAYLGDRGVEQAWDYNHGLACEGAALLADAWRTEVPATKAETGCMATVAVPESLGSEPTDAQRLRDALLFDHGIEVQVHATHGRVWVRISAQVYNELDDVARLAEAVLAISASGRRP
ncbi:MAG: aminotransferase class V-fold PLP-dependent enzyme [Vicinamibacterales bacterium]